MPIPISARATLLIADPPERHDGTLGEQVVRYLALDAGRKRQATIDVPIGVQLPGWFGSRTLLDAEALRDLARDMTLRGLV